ncbi:MAG: dihydrofolate reductase family protein [Rhodoferax sp.]
MRKLKLEMQVSIDGFTADRDGRVDWMVWDWTDPWTWDDALRRHHTALTTSSDCLLLSRKMADEGFMDHWAGVARDASRPQASFAAHITEMRKIVFSNTLEKPAWTGVELVSGGMVEKVTRLKAEPGADILVYGGPTFASALVDADLIDEFHWFVNPAVLGAGRAMLKDLHRRSTLRLQSAQAFQCGVAVLTYTRSAEGSW